MKKFFIQLLNNNYFIVLLVILIGIGSNYFLNDDNVIEEIAEKVIEEETGINIDLTPESPEN